MSEYHRERLAWLDEHNFCHKCGKAKQLPNRKFCADCLYKINEYNAKHYDKEKAHNYQTRRKEIYNEHKKNGICVRCSLPATHGIYCYEHSIAAKRHSLKMAQKRKRERHERGLVPEFRKSNGLCYFCGKPLENRRKKYTQCCRECWNKFAKISLRGDKTYFKAWRNAFWEEKKRGKNNAM